LEDYNRRGWQRAGNPGGSKGGRKNLWSSTLAKEPVQTKREGGSEGRVVKKVDEAGASGRVKTGRRPHKREETK